MRSLLFEDSLHPVSKIDGMFVNDTNKVIVISQMLSNYLSIGDVSVVFANSANNTLSKLLEIYTTSNGIIVYYDLVYNNPITIRKFTNLLGKVVELGLRNVFVVPIHCIEWHMIKCFGQDCELRDIALSCKDYTNTHVYKYNLNPSTASHEKFCKAVFGEIVPKKFHSSCLISEYTISPEEEDILVKSLPTIYTTKSGFINISIIDLLIDLYKEFLSLFNCSTADRDRFVAKSTAYLDYLCH